MNAIINRVINATWGKLGGTAKLILVVGVALLLGMTIWLYSHSLLNGIQSRIHNWRVQAAQKEITQSKNEARQAVQVAEEALKELAIEKQVTAAERAKREVLEGILEDKKLNANQKLKAWEAVKDQPVVVTPVGTTDELCARARELGITCR